MVYSNVIAAEILQIVKVHPRTGHEDPEQE
jgi:hypothetical protein